MGRVEFFFPNKDPIYIINLKDKYTQMHTHQLKQYLKMKY